ncbi:MAG TPA: hypothetical protein ENJ54_08380 [Chloroflexi bacterium]|nr:hypothetical protein [Chloroflexota bacterium]
METQGQANVWQELAELVNALPLEERRRLRDALRRWTHDLGHNIGLVRTSEGLMRREMEQAALVVDTELLDIIGGAARSLMELLAEVRQLPEHIDDKTP